MKYVKPTMDKIEYEVEDILTASGDPKVGLLLNTMVNPEAQAGEIGSATGGDSDTFANLFS